MNFIIDDLFTTRTPFISIHLSQRPATFCSLICKNKGMLRHGGGVGWGGKCLNVFAIVSRTWKGLIRIYLSWQTNIILSVKTYIQKSLTAETLSVLFQAADVLTCTCQKLNRESARSDWIFTFFLCYSKERVSAFPFFETTIDSSPMLFNPLFINNPTDLIHKFIEA